MFELKKEVDLLERFRMKVKENEVRGRRGTYTRSDDEIIIRMVIEGKSPVEISTVFSQRSEMSIRYRIYRVLMNCNSLDEIKYN